MTSLKKIIAKILSKLNALFASSKRILLIRLERELTKGLSSDKYKTKIVIFNHFFDQDIESILYAAKGSDEYEINVTLPSTLYSLARCYLPESATEFTGYYQSSLAGSQKELKEQLVALLKKIKSRYDRLIFVSPSDQFFWIREFVNACKEAGFPFVVLDKEGTRSSHYFEIHTKEIKQYMPCICDHTLVWSQRQVEFHDLAGYPRDEIYVVGQPRSDYWFHKDLWPEKNKFFKEIGLDPDKKTVLYFDFERNNYILDVFYSKGFNWDLLLEDVHSVLFELAGEHPDMNFVFKLHPQAANIKEVIEKVARTGLKNIHVLTGASLSKDLIANADLIIGFQTTALLDSMLTEKPIIYTFWGNAPGYKEKLLPFDENKGIDIAKSKEEFKGAIQHYMSTDFAVKDPDIMRTERRKLTDVFFYNPDGFVGKRVLEKIKELSNAFERKQGNGVK